MKVVAVEEATLTLPELAELAKTGTIILTRRGKPIAALVPLEDLELLDELENAADAEDVRLAREEAARGEIVAWDDVKAELGH